MRIKKLGWTDLNISTIGLGTWAIGGVDYGSQDIRSSIKTINKAIELGVNWIDTAPVYGFGHAEEVIGKTIKDKRDKVIIATKCGIIWDEYKARGYKLKKESIRLEIEKSLKRLKIDYIDLYQIHKPIPNKDIEEAWTVIAELVKEGKIRYAGITSFSLEQLKRVQKIHPIASFQGEYSLINRELEKGFLDYCSENNIGVICYGPMHYGLLTGKFNNKYLETLSNDDFRVHVTDFRAPFFKINLKLVDDLRLIAEKNNKTVAQISIAWILRRPEITAAIVGARHPTQIEETVLAGDWDLSEEEIKGIDKLLHDTSKLKNNSYGVVSRILKLLQLTR